MAKHKDGPPVVGVAGVAREAGVSPATVSRAYNSPEMVKEEVRLKIFEVANRLNYRPHPAARALRSKRTHIVGAAIPTLDYAMFARIVHEFQAKLAEYGATTIVVTTGFDNSDIYDRVRLLFDRGAEALLLVGEVEDPRLRAWLLNNPIPVVTTYSAPPDKTFPAVGFDNYQATSEAVDHLLGLGHREFAMIAGNIAGNDRQRARMAAYRDRLTAAGANGADRIFATSLNMRGGAASINRILDLHPEVTAVVCNGDIYALGAMSACRKRGLAVPADISIVGCDDFDFAELLWPPLTTIAVPAGEMGKISAEELWQAISGRRPAKSKRMDAKLTIRGSTAPPRTRPGDRRESETS